MKEDNCFHLNVEWQFHRERADGIRGDWGICKNCGEKVIKTSTIGNLE